MNIALLSESPADEAALRVLVGAVLRKPPRLVAPGFRARGWPNVAQVLPAVIRHLHFNTDAEVLAVVVDSDDSVVHAPAHDASGYFHPHCRMCQLRAVFRQTTKKIARSPRPGGAGGVLRGVGIAVPAVEAWYLCGRDSSVTEGAWTSGQESGRLPYTRAELKLRVYGTDRPSLPFETERAVQEAERHRQDTRRLENDFPGFAALAHDLRSCRGIPVEID